MTRSRLVGGLVVAAALAAAAPEARANGRFPATIDVVFKPGDHTKMSLQVTWGLLQTEDEGASWHWMCEDAVGFGGVYDPDYAYTSTGKLFATTTSARGLAFTDDHCQWDGAPAPLGGVSPATFVSQVEYGPDGAVYAAAATINDSQIYVSHDDGASFQVLSNPGGGVDWWESMVIAPTLLAGNQTRIYLTGYTFISLPNSGPFKKRRMFRSDDSGASWTELSIVPFQFSHCLLPDLQIAAVSPTNPDLVFARVTKVNCLGIGDDIYRSPDKGATWTKVFSSGDNVLALVVRQSGQVVLGERLSGIHLSDDGGVTFGAAVPNSPEIDCMRERDDGVLFACGKNYAPENMALGTSTDAITWTPILTYTDVDDAYPGCPEGTTQHDVCYATRWCCVVNQFGIGDPACEGICPTQVVPPDAGPGGPAPDAGPSDPPDKPTCCSTGSPSSALLLGILVALPLVRRRRRVRE
jgi:MYXO-CTERM domain-containing protein